MFRSFVGLRTQFNSIVAAITFISGSLISHSGCASADPPPPSYQYAVTLEGLTKPAFQVPEGATGVDDTSYELAIRPGWAPEIPPTPTATGSGHLFTLDVDELSLNPLILRVNTPTYENSYQYGLTSGQYSADLYLVVKYSLEDGTGVLERHHVATRKIEVQAGGRIVDDAGNVLQTAEPEGPGGGGV